MCMKLTSHKKFNIFFTLQKVHDGWKNKVCFCTTCKICMIGQLKPIVTSHSVNRTWSKRSDHAPKWAWPIVFGFVAKEPLLFDPSKMNPDHETIISRVLYWLFWRPLLQQSEFVFWSGVNPNRPKMTSSGQSQILEDHGHGSWSQVQFAP